MKLLMIDNYDSFTYNIVQYFGELGAEVEVFRNDEISLADIDARLSAGQLDRLVVSPGPCSPAEAGISVAAIRHFAGKLPIHHAQLLTYLRLSDHRLGLLINFNVPLLKGSIKRIVNRL